MLLTVKTKNTSARTYPLGPGHMLIGRDPACDIRLADLQASPRHACIHRLGTRYEIEDLRSAQGTVVNGKPVARHQLQAGDHIQVGDTEMAVEGPPTQARTPRPPGPDLLHELRNPLLVIQLTHQSMLDQLESTTSVGDDRVVLQDLLKDMKRGIDQVRDLLQSSPMVL